MADQPQGAPPAGNNPPAAAQQPPKAETPPAEGQKPSEGQEGNQGGQKVEIDLEELNKLKRDAGRWNGRKDNRSDRSSTRSRERDRSGNSAGQNGDDETPEQIAERDRIIAEKTRENTVLKAQNKVRDLLDSDEYKAIPDGLKRAIRNNPIAFVRQDSESVDHMIEDIQDFLDDELDQIGKVPQAPSHQAQPKPEERPTPPASGSGPSPALSPEVESLDGKQGAARSTAVLRNLFRSAKPGK